MDKLLQRQQHEGDRGEAVTKLKRKGKKRLAIPDAVEGRSERDETESIQRNTKEE